MLTRARKGFTLLELIVVLVVLAIIALIAIPTFQTVIGGSSQKSAVNIAQAIARDANAIAAINGDQTTGGYIADGQIEGSYSASVYFNGQERGGAGVKEPGSDTTSALVITGDGTDLGLSIMTTTSGNNNQKCSTVKLYVDGDINNAPTASGTADDGVAEQSLAVAEIDENCAFASGANTDPNA